MVFILGPPSSSSVTTRQISVVPVDAIGVLSSALPVGERIG